MEAPSISDDDAEVPVAQFAPYYTRFYLLNPARFVGFFAVCVAVVVYIVMSAPLSAAVTLHGRVVDQNEAPVRDARVTARPAAVSATSWEALTDPTGAFTLTFPEP